RPRSRPVAVAVRQPLLAPLAALCADQLRHLGLHQLLHDPAQTLAREVDALLVEQKADDLLGRHPLRLGHRGDSPLVVVLEDPTSLSATVAGPTTRLRPTRSYPTLRDVTRCGLTDASRVLYTRLETVALRACLGVGRGGGAQGRG